VTVVGFAKPLSRPKRIGIPTLYRGVRFRSRLEARYAAFFDELDWPWEYEPVDADGYIPDFLLDFEPGILLFEVKGMREELDGARLKIEMSGWEHEAVVAPGKIEGTLIGSFLSRGQHVFDWDDAELFFCLNCGKVSVKPAGGNWRCRVCGCNPGGGNEHVGVFDPAEAWASSGNRVQWRAE